MSDTNSNQDLPNGVPPPGMHFRMDHYTVTNTSRYPPTPGMPQMAPSGMGFIPPSFDGQQINASAPLIFSFVPLPPIPIFSPSLPNQGMRS